MGLISLIAMLIVIVVSALFIYLQKRRGNAASPGLRILGGVILAFQAVWLAAYFSGVLYQLNPNETAFFLMFLAVGLAGVFYTIYLLIKKRYCWPQVPVFALGLLALVVGALSLLISNM